MLKGSATILVLLVLSLSAKAQSYYVPQTMHTPYGNVTYQQRIYMPTHYGTGAPSNPKFDFTLILQNDSVINVRSRVLSEDKKMYILQKIKKKERKFFPAETKEIYGFSQGWGRIKGIPADSCWLFKTFYGAINSYSSLPMMDSDATIAIQQGEGGKIVALSKKNLEAITGTTDEKIVKWLSKNKLVKVIEYYNKKKKEESSASNSEKK